MYGINRFFWGKGSWFLWLLKKHDLEKMNNHDLQTVSQRHYFWSFTEGEQLHRPLGKGTPNSFLEIYFLSPSHIGTGVMVFGRPSWDYPGDLLIKSVSWSLLSYTSLTGKQSNSPRLRKILFIPLGSDSGIVSKYWRARTSNKPMRKHLFGKIIQNLRLEINWSVLISNVLFLWLNIIIK